MIKNRELFPLVSVDIALFSVVDECLKVLLVKRAQETEVRAMGIAWWRAQTPSGQLS